MSELYEIFAECCREIKQNNMEKKFKCKDEVLFRFKDDKKYKWTYGIVSHETGNFIILCGETCLLKENYDVIPYFGNEHLVGTTDEHEEIVLKEGELVLLSYTALALKEGKGTISGYEEIVYGNIIAATNGRHYNYCIPMSKYNFNNLEESSKWILCAKNGKLEKENLK